MTKMGPPSRVTDGGVSVYGGSKSADELTPECTRELWYESALTPEQWAVCLNDSSIVVDKFHYASY